MAEVPRQLRPKAKIDPLLPVISAEIEWQLIECNAAVHAIRPGTGQSGADSRRASTLFLPN